MDINEALKCADDPESNSVVETTLAAEVRRQREEIEQLRTRAGVLLSGEPVAWMDAEGDVYKTEPTENWCPPHTPLYLHPAPSSDTVRDAERLAWLLADYGDRSNAVFRAWDGESDLRAVIDGVRGAK